jgi:hypothetical protein
MFELLKSLFDLPWKVLGFGMQMVDSVAQVSASGDSPNCGSYRAEGIVNPASSASAGGRSQSVAGEGRAGTGSGSLSYVSSGRLNTTSFVVLGEGLAAGMGDFSLQEESQRYSFPAQMARQMAADFVQPLIQPPGIGEVIGFAPWSVVVPSPLQSSVLDQIPPVPPSNFSVPGLTVADAVRLRPQEPLIARDSGKQTSVNLILGTLQIAYGPLGPLPTQLEAALERKPTLALVELGFVEALDAAISGLPARLADVASFRNDYARIVRDLRSTGAEIVLLNIPDPMDTAYFSSIDAAAQIVKLDPRLLSELWTMPADELVTVQGLNEISYQLYSASVGPASESAFVPLPTGSTVSSGVAAQLRSGVQRLNQAIAEIATAEGANLYDLNAMISRIHRAGVVVKGRTITGDYLGGFYSLNGYYPGATGQACIGNEILQLLNRKYGASYPLIDLPAVASSDPVAAYRRAAGPYWTRQDLSTPLPLPLPRAPDVNGPRPPPQEVVSQVIDTASHTLRLPPGLEQVLPVDLDHSYFGDALVAQHCRAPSEIEWTSCEMLYFRGLAMMDSHLSGYLRIKFGPPVGDWTTFQVSLEGGLVGTDAVLAAPVFFRMPGKQQLVGDVPGLVSSGRLNLRTGQVDHTPGALNIYVNFFNSAIFALVRVNPNFPTAPLSFPGQYGSATASFEQRPDGKLDFTFYGSTFVPLGAGSFFPLNFCGPSREFASIPASGMAIHPHFSLTTKASAAEESTGTADIPYNTIQEFTLFTPASSFGDLFTLSAPQLGGPALGRSRLLGRMQIQFGPQSGNSVPIVVSTTVPGGILTPLGPTPLQQLFPGRLTPGPDGFYENLRFPLRTYSLNDLSVLDDPFDLAVGALDIRNGRTLQPLLHRGFINQDLLFALVRVEPRTPKASFFFRGPGTFNGDRNGQVFSFFGSVHIPYESSYLASGGASQAPLAFPDPNLATSFPVTGGGSLDPYLWLWGIRNSVVADYSATGHYERLVSSRGEVFSYHFTIHGSSGPARATFYYENHAQQGKFHMHSVAWTDYGRASGSYRIDTVSFSGFGVWSMNGVEQVTQVAAQFFTTPGVSYVGIQIGPGGEISNVNSLLPATAFPIPNLDVQETTPDHERSARTRHSEEHPSKEKGPMYSHIIELTATSPEQAKVLVDVLRDRALPEIIRHSPGFVDEIVLLSSTQPNQVSAISFWTSKVDGDNFLENGFAQVSDITKPYLSAKPESSEFVVGASTNHKILGWQ